MNALRKVLIVCCVAAVAFAWLPSVEAAQRWGTVGQNGYYGEPVVGYGGGPSGSYRYGGGAIGYGYPSRYHGGGLYQQGYGRGFYGPGNWNRGFVGPSNGLYGPGFGIRF